MDSTLSFPTPPAASAGGSSRRVPWLSLALLSGLVLVAAATLGDGPLADPRELAWAWGDGAAPSLGLWWLAHGDGWHLAANLIVLALLGPALERYVGPLRLALVVVAANLLGLLAHGWVAMADDPLLGASAMVYGVIAYSLVVGWHCPFEAPRGLPLRVWPAPLFHAIVVVEVLRWVAQAAQLRPIGGAAAHLGGLAAGVLVCGVLHRRWPAGPTSRRAAGSGAPPPLAGRGGFRGAVWTSTRRGSAAAAATIMDGRTVGDAE